jgi:hypothetical protein
MFEKGSEWRKWDLHVHTPMSVYQNFGSDDEESWEKYILDLENLSEDFAVIGVNDYIFIDGYEKLKKEQEENNRIQNLKLLPVLEFRIDKFAGIDFKQLKRINLHVIFSDEISVETIKSQFLNALEQSYVLEDGEQWSRAITKESISELGKNIKESIPKSELHKFGSDLFEGFNNINVKEEQIYSSLKKDCFKGKYLIAIGKTEWDELKWSDSSIATKKSIINKADLVFTSAASIENFEKARLQLQKQNVNHLLLDCSDAHNNSKSSDKDKIGNCFTWIKADPTFEGLKQVLFEYEERVKIQESNPILDFDKPFFSKISMAEDQMIFTDDIELKFQKNESGIPLNQNLVAIIGGRGEGKSMLTEYFASGFEGQKNSKEDAFQKNGSFVIEYFKTNQKNDEKVNFKLTEEKHSIDFLYINQGRLKKIAEDIEGKNILTHEIRRLAKLTLTTFDKNLDTEILNDLIEFHKLDEFFLEKNEQGALTNSLEYLKQKESSIQDFIKNITTTENKDKLSRYSSNINKNNSLKLKKEELEKFSKEIILTIKDINKNIEVLNLKENKIPLLKDEVFKGQITAANNWINDIEKSIIDNTKSINSVKEEFKDYKGDLTTLLNDIDKFQTQLFEIKSEIQNIKKQKERKALLKSKLFGSGKSEDSYVSKIKMEYESQKKILEDDWLRFTKIEERSDLNISQKEIMKKLLEDLSIEVIIDFDVEKFYSEISNAINGAVWRAKNNTKAQKDKIKIVDLDSFFEFINKKYLISCQEAWFYKDLFYKIFFEDSIRSKFIKVFPVLKYQGRNINKLSVGQKGTVYLKMMLATEAFSKPIIFDQPEDDLDNEFIMKELIDLFKTLKKYRQVIIITHNANLVVNADAEQIIVAQNNDGKLNYISGSLENQIINDSICKILEGGRTAFEKRRDKYKYAK